MTTHRTWATRFSAMRLCAKLGEYDAGPRGMPRSAPAAQSPHGAGAPRMHSQPDQPRRGGGRRIGGAWPEPPDPEPDLDGRAEALRQYVESVRLRARSAASWLETSGHYTRLINRDGVVPVTARFSAEDLGFLAKARQELLSFAELGLRLADLHQPLEDGAIASHPPTHIQPRPSCMWRRPCPPLRLLDQRLPAD